MPKINSEPVLFVGGPYHYRKQKMNSCMKTHKIKSKDFVCEYVRPSPYDSSMIWQESNKRWYLVAADSKVTEEKIEKLGCWAVLEPTLSWKNISGKNILVRRIGIDVETMFSAFELYYAEDIEYVYPNLFKTLYDLKRSL